METGGLRKRQLKNNNTTTNVNNDDDNNDNNNSNNPTITTTRPTTQILLSEYNNDDDDGDDNDVDHANTSSATVTVTTAKQKIPTGNNKNNKVKKQQRQRWIIHVHFFLYLLLHVVAVIWFILGFVYRIKLQLHTGVECDMTYSYRIFLEIDVPTTTSSSVSSSSSAASSVSSTSSFKLMSQYKLYKFVDQRDLRYRSLWNNNNDPSYNDKQQQQQPLTGSKWCTGDVVKILPNSKSNNGTTTTTTTNNRNNNNNNTKRIVLYIPGHWGSYEQSRSIGAHGIQLTRSRDSVVYTKHVQNSLVNNVWTGNSFSQSQFTYDVYSVDFAQQGTALHGEYIVAQSEYIIHVVTMLTKTCNVPSVTVVAHSMGGYSAKLASIKMLDRHHDSSPKQKQQHLMMIRDIITLATPHQYPLYAWDSSIYDIHQRILQQQQQQHERKDNDKQLIIVSLSGGLRDEMIEPYSCNANSNDDNSSSSFVAAATITALSSRLIPRGSLGMDHQAIVWCHDVLTIVRDLIWTLSITENQSVTDRLQGVSKIIGGGNPSTGGQDYTRDVQNVKTEFRRLFGFMKAACMESAMLYNLPILVSLFAITAGFNYVITPLLPKPWSYIIPVVVCACGWTWSDLRGLPVLILALVANTVHGCTLHGMIFLSRILCSSVENNRFWRLFISSFVSLFLMHILGVAYSVWSNGDWSFLPIDVAAYMSTVILVYVSAFQLVGRSAGSPVSSGHFHVDAYYAVLIVVTMPFLVAGQVSLMSWEGSTRRSSWQFLVWTCAPILVACHMKRPVAGHSVPGQVWHSSFSFLLAVFILFWSRWCLPRGTGFRLTTLIRVISWSDVVFALLAPKGSSQAATKD